MSRTDPAAEGRRELPLRAPLGREEPEADASEPKDDTVPAAELRTDAREEAEARRPGPLRECLALALPGIAISAPFVFVYALISDGEFEMDSEAFFMMAAWPMALVCCPCICCASAIGLTTWDD